MYEQFFGLKEKPFTILPDASYLYLSSVHKKALTALRYALASRQGFVVMSGEVGSGKTTLINQLLMEMGDDITVGLINFTTGEYESLAEWIMMSFGLDYTGKSQAELYDGFVQFLIDQYAADQRTILIIDEAQNMGVRGLESVRMLSNVNAKQDNLLQLVLVGQPELQTLLSQPELRQLQQRISVAYHIGGLSQLEVIEYVRHRLGVAGGSQDIFEPAALALVAGVSKGIPRVINTLCDMALVYGYSEGRKTVDHGLMKSVITDRINMGLLSKADVIQAVSA